MFECYVRLRPPLLEEIRPPSVRSSLQLHRASNTVTVNGELFSYPKLVWDGDAIQNKVMARLVKQVRGSSVYQRCVHSMLCPSPTNTFPTPPHFLPRTLKLSKPKPFDQTLIAYGPPRSGKTFTLFSPPKCVNEVTFGGCLPPVYPSEWGLAPRLLTQFLGQASVSAFEVRQSEKRREAGRRAVKCPN